jgi:ubiquinone/menaquinone biosynthesis C-methylase UbiE
MSDKPGWLYIPEWLLSDTWHFPYAYSTFGKYIPQDSLVLEVGFGSGRILTRIASDKHCKCVGVDVVDGAFPSLSFFSQQHGVKVEAIKGSGFSLPFKDKSFDVVYSEGVIEHFPADYAMAMVKEHARVCRSGGRVLVSVPNKFALVHSLTKRLLGKKFLFYPENSLSTFELSSLMTNAGLSIAMRDGFAFGCQFYMFQAFFLDQTSSAILKRIGMRCLNLFRKTSLYHFENPRVNSLIGFQTLVMGRPKY